MDRLSTIQLRTNNEMPVMGLGTWELTKDTAETVEHAIKVGYRHIDTSSDYRTQPGIAKAIKRSGIDRDELYITTKVEQTDDSYARTKSNLKELDLDYIDLMLIHRPPYRGAGEELWEGLIRARDQGLVRDIGVSNYSIPLIDWLIDKSGEVPSVNQVEWHPFGHSEQLREYCSNKSIVIQAYSPLTRTKRLGDQTLTQLAERYGKSAAQILVRWNLQSGTVPLPKANQRRHLEENLDVYDFEIEPLDMLVLNDLNEYYSCLGSLPYIPSPWAA